MINIQGSGSQDTGLFLWFNFQLRLPVSWPHRHSFEWFPHESKLTTGRIMRVSTVEVMTPLIATVARGMFESRLRLRHSRYHVARTSALLTRRVSMALVSLERLFWHLRIPWTAISWTWDRWRLGLGLDLHNIISSNALEMGHMRPTHPTHILQISNDIFE